MFIPSIRPSIATLEQALYQYLMGIESIGEVATITPSHPEDKIDMPSDQGLIVLTMINDTRSGKVVTPLLASPSIQFACYAATAPMASYIKELVDHAIPSASLEMPNQQVQTVQFVDAIEALFDQDSGLYVAQVSYRFHLTKNDRDRP